MAVSPSIQLAAGQSVWWVLKVPPLPAGSSLPTYSPKGRPMKLSWEAGQATSIEAVQALNASGYQMALYGAGATPHKDPVPTAACWQTVSGTA
jgi:hypothetical protein